MNTRLVFCIALVAMAFGAANADQGASASANLDLSLSKGETTAAAAEATTAAANSAVAVLSVPQVSVDVSIKKEKVPLLTVSEGPCKKICKNKCTITMEKQCLTVDVPKKHCALEKKTVNKQFCEKKCKPSLKLDLPEFKLPTLPKVVPADANPSAPPAAVNPSAPPAAVEAKTETQASLLKYSKSAALSASAGATDAKVAGSVDVDVSASTEGRRLQGLIGHKLPKANLDVECQDVCVTVPLITPELKCSETTEKVEKCTQVPNKQCKEECVCLPQKTLSFSLPKKPSVSLSLDKSGGL